jgi:translocator protein
MFPILIPLILNFIFQKVVPTKFEEVPSSIIQPPGYVFGIVWTVLYLCLGVHIQWELVDAADLNITLLFFTVVNLLLNMGWGPFVANTNNYILGFYWCAGMLMSSACMIILSEHKFSQLVLIPYLVWLLVAMLLSLETARPRKHVRFNV